MLYPHQHACHDCASCLHSDNTPKACPKLPCGPPLLSALAGAGGRLESLKLGDCARLTALRPLAACVRLRTLYLGGRACASPVTLARLRVRVRVRVRMRVWLLSRVQGGSSVERTTRASISMLRPASHQPRQCMEFHGMSGPPRVHGDGGQRFLRGLEPSAVAGRRMHCLADGRIATSLSPSCAPPTVVARGAEQPCRILMRRAEGRSTAFLERSVASHVGAVASLAPLGSSPACRVAGRRDPGTTNDEEPSASARRPRPGTQCTRVLHMGNGPQACSCRV